MKNKEIVEKVLKEFNLEDIEGIVEAVLNESRIINGHGDQE